MNDELSAPAFASGGLCDANFEVAFPVTEEWELLFRLRTEPGRLTYLHPLDCLLHGLDSFAWMHDQLRRCDYKPNWSWKVMMYRYDHPALETCFNAPNSYDPLQMTTVKGFAVPPTSVLKARSPEMFVAWLAHTMLALETHESQEWLRHDNKVWNDPHKSATPVLPVGDNGLDQAS